MEPSGATGQSTCSPAPTVGQAVRRGVFGLLVAISLYVPAFPLAFASLFFATGAFDDQCFSPDAGDPSGDPSSWVTRSDPDRG